MSRAVCGLEDGAVPVQKAVGHRSSLSPVERLGGSTSPQGRRERRGFPKANPK